MNRFWQLNKFVNKVIKYALEENISFEIFSYSPENKQFFKVNPDELELFSIQNKYIISFNKNSFKKLEHLFKKDHPNLKENIDSLQKNNLYGYDIFQLVQFFSLHIYRAKSSKRFNLEEFEKQEDRWIRAQIDTDEIYSDISEDEIIEKLKVIFNKAKHYLCLKGKEAKLTVSRISGISHKIKIGPNTIEGKSLKNWSYVFIKNKKIMLPYKNNKRKSVFNHISYRPVVFLFSESENLPNNINNKNYNTESLNEYKIHNRIDDHKYTKPYKNSINKQYELEPENFDFYEKIGIFEIFNKKHN